MSLPVQVVRTYRFGSFEVSIETGELRKNGRKVHIQEKPFQVLVALIEEQGKLVTRETLRQRLWPAHTFVDFDNGLNTAVSKLREALGDSVEGHQYFETLARRGYRFVASAKEFGPPTATQRRELEIRRTLIEPNIVVVEIVGRITLGGESQQIEWLVADLVSENQTKIVFDISGVTYVDSTGVGIIIMCFGKLKKAGGELRLAAAKRAVEDVLKMTKVDSIVGLYPTTAAALESFRAGRLKAEPHCPISEP